MSWVNIVPTACTCESKEFMIAANTPAARSPASTPGAWRSIILHQDRARGLRRQVREVGAREHAEDHADGSQTIAMHSG